MKKIVILLACVLVAVVLGVALFFLFTVPQGSLGIIGGADGPTAIFVTCSLNLPQIFLIVGIIIFGAAVFLWKKKKK